MKKFFYPILTVVTMLLAVTSCSQDEDFVQQSNSAAVTKFSVSLDGLVGSRAYGLGTTATQLYYEVYRGETCILDNETNPVNIKDKTAIVEMPLLKGETYDIIFWAQAEGCTIYQISNLKNITIDYDNTQLNANQETYDAFYNALNGFKADGKSHTIELRRPFAQLNLGTSDWDNAKQGLAQSEGDPVTQTSVKVVGLANNFKPLTGEATGDATATFALGNIPAGNFKVNGTDYKWLSMNYLLVPNSKTPQGENEYQEESAEEKANVNLTFALNRGTKELFTIDVPNAPVQRNWRTNVVGALLTGSKFEVIIKPGFDGEYNTSDILSESLKKGGTLKLTSNYHLDAPVEVPEGVTVTLDLNGYEIIGTKGVENGSRVHVIKNYGTLNITGKGTIASKGINGGSAIYNEGTMTVENVTLEGAPFGTTSNPSYAINSNGGKMSLNNVTITAQHGAICAYNSGEITLNNVTATMGLNGKTHAVIYTYSNGQVIINSGTYTNKATDQSSTGASAINGKVIVNGGTINGRIESYYGTPEIKGGTFSVNPTSYINQTCKVVDNGNGTWTVVPTIEDSDALLDAINNGKTNIVLAAGNYTMPDGSKSVNLQGKTLFISGGKDVILDVAHIDERDQFVTNANLSFEGITLNFGQTHYMGFANPAKLSYKHCDINGWQFFSGAGEITFENCNLNSNGAEHCAWTWGGQNITFTDCDFTYSDRAINCYGENVTTNVTFTNCIFTKVAGQPTTGAIETNSSTLTALNLNINNCSVNEGDLWWVSTWDDLKGANTHVTIDGKSLALTATQFTDAIADAADGSTVVLANNVSLTSLAIDKPITIDLGQKELAADNGFGIISLKNGASIKNGIVNIKSNVAAIRAFNVGSIENVTIKTEAKATNKKVTGIAIQEGGYVGSIKNVTIEGVGQGIELGHQATVDLIDNVNVIMTNNGTSEGKGLVINGGYVGKAVDCTFKGETYGVTMHLKGVFDVGLELVNCKVEGGTASVNAWDEKGISNTSGSLTLTYDAATILTGNFVWDFEDECLSVVKLNAPTNN